MSLLLTNIVMKLGRHLWIVDNYWLRSSLLRGSVLRLQFYFRRILERDGFGRKAAAINQFIEDTLVNDPLKARYFTAGTGNIEDLAPQGGEPGMTPAAARRMRSGYLMPDRLFYDRLRDLLMGLTMRGEEERSFRLNALIDLEKELYEQRKTTGHFQKVFSRDFRENFRSFFGAGGEDRAVPESYIRHFFPALNAGEFVRNGVEFILADKKLFGPRETASVIDFFIARVRMRNPRNLFHRATLLFKKTAIGAFLAFYIVLFLFDLAVLFYGTLKNEYYYSFQYPGQTIVTRATPYAHRANRIFRRNHKARFADFKFSGKTPPPGDSYRINNREQIAVELNYRAYRSLRVQDQNGLTAIAVDRGKMEVLSKSDPRRYRELLGRVVDLRWWESVLSFIDAASGDRLNLFNAGSITPERINEDIAGAIMNSVTPLEWINRVNEVSDVITVLYYKANSMKFAPINEIPDIMTKAIILREDRRFRNILFPLPHRGNDNLVIIPQVTKKLLRKMFDAAHTLAGRYGLDRLDMIFAEYEKKFSESIRDENRGGSSISNQVMEMLYTKYITSMPGDADFADRQIEQKEHELPASLAVDWFWSRNHILEAYANEVYGGHLYSDIRGFKSQAEIYFMRGLRDLNLREKVMLVAAIKKPTRIKEYAYWLKAEELGALIEGGAARPDVALWEKENGVYRVDRANYREILASKLKARIWIEKRMNNILRLLRDNGEIGEDEYRDARYRMKVAFRFAPGIISADNRLVNNIRREIDRELGQDRSDAGMVVVTTIDMAAQRKLQEIIDRGSRWITVDPEDLAEGQPENVRLEGGARIIQAHDRALSGRPRILNRIIADVGGPSSVDDEWDWVSLANRSLGSSLKPLLDFYFILSGYNLQDMFKNSRVTYHTYTLEQQRIFQNYIHKYPKRWKEIEEIEKYWSWSPRNFKEYTNEWISVEDALVHSVNGVHVQIQELVTPAVFARLLNETMGITDPEAKHQPFRSIILGGSGGDQRYDRYLLAYSLFPNQGIIQKHTFIDFMRGPDGGVIRPSYRPTASPLLEKFGAGRVRAAALLIGRALRETVKHGTMAGMEGIGAGKTGTSNQLRDALATVHFIAGDSAYIAGVRLGNRRNFSIGRAADRIAVPLLKNIVTGTFDRSTIMSGDDFDVYLDRLARSCGEIASADGRFFLKGRSPLPRRLEVARTREEKRGEFLAVADKNYADGRYDDAVRYYEQFLRLAVEFDSNHPAFTRMVHSYIENGNLERAQQLIERFSRPGRITKIARIFEKKYDVTLKVNKDFYSGDEEYESRKREKKLKINIKPLETDNKAPVENINPPERNDGAPDGTKNTPESD
jgi:membrane peptidoglycan carboxypeptidase